MNNKQLGIILGLIKGRSKTVFSKIGSLGIFHNTSVPNHISRLRNGTWKLSIVEYQNGAGNWVSYVIPST